MKTSPFLIASIIMSSTASASEYINVNMTHLESGQHVFHMHQIDVCGLIN